MKRRSLTLQEHQEILYDLLYTFDDFCKEHDIHYFLAGGTLLGAVRHGGIIPWDDDADVVLPRPEYDRLLELLHSNCPDNYILYDIDHTKGYYYPYAKFGRSGTLLIEEDWHCTPSKGLTINIDIFPLDGCPDNYQDAQNFIVSSFRSNVTKLRFWFDNDGSSLTLKTKMMLALRHFPCIMKYTFRKKFRRGTIYKYDSSEFVANTVWGWYGERELMDKAVFKDTLLMQFGDRKLPVPAGYDDYLSRLYGDYMTPPPPDKRLSTHRDKTFIL